MSKIYTTHADITPEQNAAFEARYGKANIRDLEITVDDKTFKYVVRIPDRQVLEAVTRHGHKEDFVAANKALISNCVLGGDMEAVDKNGSVYLEVVQQLSALKQKATGSIKKR